jgi:hypothetical protein
MLNGIPMQKLTHKQLYTHTNEKIKKEPQQQDNKTVKQNDKVDVEEQLRRFAQLLVNIYLSNQENELE